MSLTTEQADRILRLFHVPSLTADQRIGTRCAWCAIPLHESTGRIDLGGVGAWTPHACTTCYDARRTWLDTYYRWLDHTRTCRACRRADRCLTSLGHRVLYLAALRQLGRPLGDCPACRHPIQPGDRFEPLLSDGQSGLIFGHTHTGPCPEAAVNRHP